MTPDVSVEDARRLPAAAPIEAAAARLNDLRTAWLYPADLVVSRPEIAVGFPNRVSPKDKEAAAALVARTMTSLYNERPDWLLDAHRTLDEAVAAAYGWLPEIETG